MKASDLIKAASGRAKASTLSAALLADLKAICEHNDAAPVNQRVRVEDACKLLEEGGVRCSTGTTLQAICREQLGRTSWAKK